MINRTYSKFKYNYSLKKMKNNKIIDDNLIKK